MIIDASVAFKLVVEEADSAEAVALLERDELVAPTLIHSEVGNALWKRVRRGELVSSEEIAERLADMASYIRTVDETAVLPRALELAIELEHPVYDCVYLALGEAEQEELITADRRFYDLVRGTSHGARMRMLGSD